jgi:addiction module RelE/StbE family toxin
MILQYKKTFQKQYGKLNSLQKEKVNSALRIFRQNPADEKLKNHALQGKMAGLRSISGGFDLRLIFVEEGNYTKVIMLKVGTHSQLY